MSAGKKPVTQVNTRAAWAFLDSVSKAFLADLVVDLVRRNAGAEDLDGIELTTAIASEASAITAARNDEQAVKEARKAAVRAAVRDAIEAEGYREGHRAGMAHGAALRNDLSDADAGDEASVMLRYDGDIADDATLAAREHHIPDADRPAWCRGYTLGAAQAHSEIHAAWEGEAQ